MTEQNIYITGCEEISDMLTGYINRKLTQEENFTVIKHLVKCTECRENAALLFKIKSLSQNSMINLPHDLEKSAFEKIPEQKNEVNSILKSGSVSIPFDLINHYLSPLKQTLKLVKQVI